MVGTYPSIIIILLTIDHHLAQSDRIDALELISTIHAAKI